tara:strand:- start:599 stop:3067 length:2469 start_codon:yes stop_codon:yes gene_type:complete
MSIIQAAGAGEAATAFYPFDITNSLRFNDDDSAFLSRTPSTTSGSSRRIFTFSCWFKYTHGTGQNIWTAGDDANNRTHIDFNSDGSFQIESKSGGSEQFKLEGTPLFRDPAAWYNLVWAVDTTQSTGSNRVKAYINGSEVTFSSANYGSSPNFDTAINNTVLHTIGRRSYADSNYFNGYIAEVNFIDGSALGPSSFGETKENIWVAKDTSGLTFGTNGFRLQFKNSSVGSASSSTVGADTSGKGHHFSSTNLATTDNMTDSPVDNHCVMSPITVAESQAQATLSEGNLKVDLGTPGSSVAHTYGTIAIPASGKYFFEGTFSNVSGGPRIGISVVRTSGNQSRYVYISDGQKIVNTTGSSYGASYSASDVIGVAVNVDDNEITFFKNGSSQGAFTIDLTLSTGGSSSDYFPFITNGSGSSTSVVEFNFGARDFAHTPPSGFVALSTANLPDPAIDPAQGENPTEYWDAQLYTGDSGTQEISKFAFQPDWVWIKNRDNADDHYMYDSIRGATKTLHPNDTPKEFTSANALQSFDSDGFTTGGDGGTNRNTQDYVAWAWRAGGVPTADNSAGAGNTPTAGSVKIDGSNLGSALGGTIAATRISANTEAGFSIVSYTGTGANATVAHGLNAVPEWIIFRDRDNINDWVVYHVGLGNTNFVKLNESIVSTDNDTIFNDTTPTSSLFSLGSANLANNSSQKHIAYCFAPKEGYSKFGSYDDNVIGSDYENTSPFVYTGFRVGWLMIKGTSAGREWVMYDNKRTPDNGVYLRANTAAVEQTDATNHDISFLSNGFKIRGGSGDINTTGESYIYMAFADQPFKFANGGTE